MIKNYFLITVRNFQKQKAYSFINVFGLSIGLAVCVILSLWVIDELNYDQFHTNKANLYRVIVEQKDATGEYLSAITQFPLASSLESEFPDIINSCRYYGNNSPQIAKYNDKISKINNVAYADKTFLELFSFDLGKGDKHTALENVNSIVLSNKEAQKFFGDSNPIGKIMTIDYFGSPREFMVSGVLKDQNFNSHLKFDAIIPFHIFNSLYEGVTGWEYASNYYTYVLLNSNADVDQLNMKFKTFLSKYVPKSKDELLLQPITDIHLTSSVKFDPATNIDIKYIYFFTLIAAFTIFIACINFMNLSTARAEKRAKEIGLRKVIGAQRKQIIVQFFSESVWYTLIAFLLALFVVEITLPLFNEVSGKNISLLSIFSGGFVYLLVMIIALTAITAGSYPALFLSSFNPVEVIRQQSAGSRKGSLFRKLLIILQFSLSTIMISATLIVSEQLNLLQKHDLGFDKDNIVYLTIPRSSVDEMEFIKNELLRYPDIISIGSSNILPTHGNESNFSNWDGNMENKNVLFNITGVDYGYLPTLGMNLMEGRFFDRKFSSDLDEACIINEEAVKRMGMINPIGKKLEGYTIIGVVKNYNYMSLHNQIEPIFLNCLPRYANYVYVKINSGDYAATLRKIEQVYVKYIPNTPFEYHFLDATIGNLYKVEERSRILFSCFTFLAIFISSLGLLGLITFVIERRIKEIGIRKVLGASIPGIVNLLLMGFIKLIIVANIVACPAAYVVMNNWLQNYAYKTEISQWIFIFSLLITLFLVLVTVGYHSIKVAVTNPIKSIRYE